MLYKSTVDFNIYTKSSVKTNFEKVVRCDIMMLIYDDIVYGEYLHY